MKRIISCLLILTLLLCMVGCFGENNSSGSEKESVLPSQGEITSQESSHTQEETNSQEPSHTQAETDSQEPSNTQEEQGSEETGDVTMNYSYYTGTNYEDDLPQEGEWGVYSGDAIPNVETAVAVATAIFKAIPIDQSRIVITVRYDTDDRFWIVYFGSGDVEVDGSSFGIALKQETGEVIRMFAE